MSIPLKIRVIEKNIKFTRSHEALWKDAHMAVTNYKMFVFIMTIPLLIKHINAVRFGALCIKHTILKNVVQESKFL